MTVYGSSFGGVPGGGLAATDMMPAADTTKSRVCTTRGKRMKPDADGSFACLAIVPPRIIAEMTSAAMDSNRSAPRAEQSPTLSPTKSAMTAGLRGSSSGMPCSTFPTRSAPTSAALV